jgi:hypothetical protein
MPFAATWAILAGGGFAGGAAGLEGGLAAACGAGASAARGDDIVIARLTTAQQARRTDVRAAALGKIMLQ